MTRTVESIAQYGVLAPLIARPRPEGGYEIISGHRRQYAAKLAGLDTLPVIVRKMSDDAAVILMVDSNLQREHILPSERAFAYKMKLKALKNQGARSDLTSCQVGTKFRADESLAEDSGESARNVQRFIRQMCIRDRAKAELGKDSFSFTMVVDADDAPQKVAQVVQEQLQTTLPGFTLELKVEPKKQRVQDMQDGNFEIGLTR